MQTRIAAAWLTALLLIGAGCGPRDHPKPAPADPAGSAAPLQAASIGPSHEERTQGARPFRELVGLNVKFNQGQPLDDLLTLTDLGVRWVRDSVAWYIVEPRPGHFVDFPPEFRRRLSYYKRNGIGVVFLLAYQNSVAYRPTKDEPHRAIDPVAFGRYAVEVAKQMRASGVQFVLEIWNEPHNFVIGPQLSGSWNGRPPAPWLRHYVKMVRETVRQVKALDRTVKLLTDEDMWVLHYWFLEEGLPNLLDGFAFHPYTLAGPERTAVKEDTDWVKPFSVVDADASFASAVRRLRDRGREKLGRVPEMWITEWGWKLGQHSPHGPVSEALVAAFLVRAYVVAAAAGVEVLCWFSARDSVDGPMGLLTNDGRRRQPYFAFKTMTAQLGHTTFRKHVWGSDHRTQGVQSFLFVGEREDTLVAWSVEESRPRLSLSGPLRDARITSVLGEPVAPSTDEKGERYLVLGVSPHYLAFPRELDSFVLE